MSRSNRNPVVAGAAHAAGAGIRHPGDFTTGPRVLFISAIALLIGIGGVLAGAVLLHLIRLVTNIGEQQPRVIATVIAGVIAGVIASEAKQSRSACGLPHVARPGSFGFARNDTDERGHQAPTRIMADRTKPHRPGNQPA